MPYANKEIREIQYPTVNTTYNSTQDMINRVQSSKGKTKLKFQQSISIFYDEMNIRIQSGTFQSEEDFFSKNSEKK